VIEQLKTLEELQHIDLKIDEVKRNQSEYPKRIAEYRQQIETEKLALQTVEAALSELQKHKRSKEVDLQRMEERIENDRAKLMQVKTNKEYHAMQKEIENLRAEHDEMETGILKMMERNEEQEHEVRRARESFRVAEQKCQAEIDKFDQELKRIDEALEDMVDKYDEIAARIEPALIDRYLQVRKLRRGVAVVPVIKWTCQGCHMRIPPQVYNLVIRNEDLITCPNCHRILYYSEG